MLVEHTDASPFGNHIQPIFVDAHTDGRCARDGAREFVVSGPSRDQTLVIVRHVDAAVFDSRQIQMGSVQLGKQFDRRE